MSQYRVTVEYSIGSTVTDEIITTEASSEIEACVFAEIQMALTHDDSLAYLDHYFAKKVELV